jgi:hypothetical protein
VDKKQAARLLAQLATNGLPPRELNLAKASLDMFSVGLDDWISRLATTYFQDFSRDSSHFKLVLAPYGGGKTHFLMALGVRALEEDFGVSYVACVPDRSGAPVRVDNALGLYAEVIAKLRIKGRQDYGISALLTAVVERKRHVIEESGVADVDGAFLMYLRQLSRNFPGGTFGEFAQVVTEALRGYWSGDDLTPAAKAAEKWLEGRMDSISQDEYKLLGLRKVAAAEKAMVGRRLLLALAKFLPDAGCHGLVLLIDEVETLFTAKGKALQSVLAAMRVLLDQAGSVPDDIPMFCVFAAVPDVLEGIRKYPALDQRLSVQGGSFEQKNDFAPQINLDNLVADHESMLASIGKKLVDVAIVAHDSKISREIQIENALKLAKVANRQTLDVNSRRLFVKTWASLLELQITTGQKSFNEEELLQRYQGDFSQVQSADKEAFEP